jgi:hypothetical protein
MMKKYYLIWKKGENGSTQYKWGEWTDGNITFDEAGEYQVSYIEGWTAETSVQQGGASGDYIAVNLGLPSGNLWANKNLGAETDRDPGWYIAWGELQEHEPKHYDKDYYEHYSQSDDTYDSPNGIAKGTYGFQGKAWDAVTHTLGGKWVTPSNPDIQELIDNCDWEWRVDTTTSPYTSGFTVTSRADPRVSIFLPVTGYWGLNDKTSANKGYYWSSSLYLFPADWDKARDAVCLEFGVDSENPYDYLVNKERYYGLVIRPIQLAGEPEPFEPHFAITPLFLDSKLEGSGLVNNFEVSSGYYTNGNQMFVGVTDTNISMSEIEIEDNDTKFQVLPLDDYGFLFSKNIGYNDWEGGTVGSTTHKTFTIKVYDIVTTISAYTTSDEDNYILGNGCYINKVYKVPSDGGTVVAKSYLFPEDFASEVFDDDFKPKVYQVQWKGADGKPMQTPSTVQITDGQSSDGHIYSNISMEYESLQSKITFTIPSNGTKKWKDECFLVYDSMLGFNYNRMCLIRILQEPASTTRIYYGYPHHPLYTGEYSANDDDLALEEYHNNGDGEYSWKYLFNTLGSYCVGLDFAFTTPNTRPVGSDAYEFLLPQGMKDDYDITVKRADNDEEEFISYDDADFIGQVSGTYTWGGVVYERYQVTINHITVKFRKKHVN